MPAFRPAQIPQIAPSAERITTRDMNANPHEGTGQLKMRTPEWLRIGQSIFAMTAMRRQPRLPRRTTFLAERPHSPHRTHNHR
jgi:hypothetical protein